MTTETKDDDLKVNLQLDGSAVVGDPPAEPDAKPASDNAADAEGAAEDTRLVSEEDEEHGHADETEEERVARTERNRARRKESKERRKDYIESLKRDLAARDAVINELSQRMAVVERKSTGSEMAQLEVAEKEALAYYNQFKTMHGQAVEQANGTAAADAMEKMLLARQRLDQIGNIKKAMTQQQQPRPQTLDPRVQANASSWMERNRWFDINGGDDDSRLVLMIDQMVRDAGYLPETSQYWEEVDVRIKKHLPHRSNSGYNRPTETSRRGPPVAGSGKEGSTGNKGGYTLSADRVQALKDAGIWDDPVQRANAIKRYQQFDKEATK